MWLVAKDGRLARGTVMGLRIPKAPVSVRDLTESAAAVCAQGPHGMVLSSAVLEKNPPQAFPPHFLLQRPWHDCRLL